MNTAIGLRHSCTKEFRALAPVLGLCAAAMVLSALPGPFAAQRTSLATAVYVFGATALGAMSIGHEYASRTLATYLAAPWSRPRLLGVKALVLFGCLTVHGVTAAASYWTFTSTMPRTSDVLSGGMTLWLVPLALAFCVAPGLTMLCRSVLAGLFFTLGIPVSLWLAAMVVNAWAVGAAGASTHEQLLALTEQLSIGVLIAAVLFAPFTWWLFQQLEAVSTPIDVPISMGRLQAILSAPLGRQPGIGDRRRVEERSGLDAHDHRLGSGSTARRSGGAREPLVALAIKELHLQQATAVIALLFVCLWTVLSTTNMAPDLRVTILGSIVTAYSALIAVLTGALSIAEERALGILPAQALLPISPRSQWIVKVGTALVVVLMLGFVLPVAMTAATSIDTPFALSRVDGRPVNPTGLLQILTCMTVLGLYVSSVSRGGLKALLVGLCVLVALATVVGLVTWFTSATLWRELGLNAMVSRPWNPARGPLWTGSDFARVNWASWGVSWLCVLGGFILLLSLGRRNHHVDRVEARTLRRQGAVIIAYFVLGSIVSASVLPLGLWMVARP